MYIYILYMHHTQLYIRNLSQIESRTQLLGNNWWSFLSETQIARSRWKNEVLWRNVAHSFHAKRTVRGTVWWEGCSPCQAGVYSKNSSSLIIKYKLDQKWILKYFWVYSDTLLQFRFFVSVTTQWLLKMESHELIITDNTANLSVSM